MRHLLLVVPLLALAACGGTDEPTADASRAPSSTASSASPSASASGGAGGSDDGGIGDQPDASGTSVCAEVRAGVDDFNTGDLEGTVQHFKKALPLARARAAQQDSQGAQSLLAAVRYYADLAPEDYPAASASSPEFAKYKIVTLGQCVVGAPSSSASGTPGTSV